MDKEETKLYRDEFLSAVSEPYGRTSVPPQRAVAIAAIAFFVGMASLLIVLNALDYTRTEAAPGMVMVDSQRIAINSLLTGPARVDSVLVRSGEKVLPGKPILVVSGESLTIRQELAGRTNSFAVLLPETDPKASVGQSASVVSTQAGYVDKVFVKGGSIINAGDLLMLVDGNPNKLKIAVLVSSRSMGLIRRSERVHVRIDSFPFQRFGTVAGKVATISESSISPMEASAIFGIAPPAENKFVVEVQLENSGSPIESQLRPGMTAITEFPVEEKSMLSWILTSILGRGRR